MLESLRASLPGGGHEIIVVDDGSVDGTREWLAQADVKFVLNPRNLGFAAAVNAGARLATGSVLALLNNDLLLRPGWLQPMLEVLLAPGLRAGVVGNVQRRVADGALDHAGVVLAPSGQFEHVRQIEPGSLPQRPCIAVTGACLLIRKADFDAVGGFDEAYFNGCEDFDLCLKLQAVGKNAYVATGSEVLHHVSLSRGGCSAQDLRNSRRLFGRWPREIKRELSSVWFRLLREGPAAWSAHVDGQLDAEFAASPYLASRVLAEAALRREQAQWARTLGEPDPNADVAQRCTAQGLTFDAALQAYRIGTKAELVVSGLDSGRSIAVGGRLLRDVAPGTVMLTVDVNGLHRRNWSLGPQREFFLELARPLLLPGINNRFTIDVHTGAAAGHLDAVASGSVALTHVVIDGHEVRQLRCGP